MIFKRPAPVRVLTTSSGKYCEARMWKNNESRAILQLARALVGLAMLCIVAAVPPVFAQDEFDSCKIRLEGFWAQRAANNAV